MLGYLEGPFVYDQSVGEVSSTHIISLQLEKVNRVADFLRSYMSGLWKCSQKPDHGLQQD